MSNFLEGYEDYPLGSKVTVTLTVEGTVVSNGISGVGVDDADGETLWIGPEGEVDFSATPASVTMERRQLELPTTPGSLILWDNGVYKQHYVLLGNGNWRNVETSIYPKGIAANNFNSGLQHDLITIVYDAGGEND